MKIRRKYLQLLVVVAVFVSVGSVWLLNSALAATGQIYMSASSVSVQSGSSFSVSLRVNPGAAIDTVNSYVAYDSSKLTLTAVDCSGSPFSAFPSCPTSGNPLNITSADLSGKVSTDSLVATLTFKATAASGSTSLTVTGDTATAGVSNGAGTAGTAVTITAVAAPTCPSGYTGTYPNCTAPSTGGTSSGGGSSSSGGGSSSGSGSTKSGGSTGTTKSGGTTTTPPKTTTPVVTPDPGGATVTKNPPTVGYTQCDFSVTSASPTQVYLQFGTSAEALTNQTTPSTFATSHDLTIDPTLLVPGQTYYYTVVSKNQAGTVTQTTVDKFTTKGLTISVRVLDANNKPVVGKSVQLHSAVSSATTDKNGYATFTNVIPGTHHVTYVASGKTYDQSIPVQNNVQTTGTTQTAAVQNFSVVYAGLKQKSSMAVVWGGIVGIVLVAILLAVVLGRKRSRFVPPGGGMLATTPVYVGGQNVGPSGPTSDQMNQHLQNIPDPNGMAPGSMVAPGPDDPNRRGQ